MTTRAPFSLCIHENLAYHYLMIDRKSVARNHNKIQSHNSVQDFQNTKLWNLGKLIREYRLSSGLDFEELSRISEIDERALREIESGLLNPSLSRLYAICNVLNIPPSEVESIFINLSDSSGQ